MGRVTASYFDASDNDVADYQGQVLGVNDRSAVLSNVTPDSQPVYDVYGYSATAALTGTGYTVLCSLNEGFTFTSGQNNWSYAPYGIYNRQIHGITQGTTPTPGLTAANGKS